MDKQKLYENYIQKDYNCAEALIRTANEEYKLGITEEALKLVSGFGGGMGYGDACGALSSAISVISKLFVADKAHATAGFGEKCGEYCRRFEQQQGSTKCSFVKEKNVAEGRRCLKTVEDAYALLEEFLIEEGKLPAEEEEELIAGPEDILRVKGLGFLHNKGTNRFNGRVITRNGRITAEENGRIAEAAQRFGDGHIALTTRLTMEVTGIPYGNIEPFREFLLQAGLETGGTGPKVRPVVSCKGTTCQYGLCDTFELADEIHRRFYKGWHDVKLPHKFKIAVGGCPNNCVKPDLNDFGIIGQRVPEFDADKCRGCGKCAIERACPIQVPKVVDGKLYISPDTCSHCGRCITKCPFGAIETGAYGYKVVVGGRWGKRSAKGQALGKLFFSKEEVLSVLEKSLLLFRDQGVAGERFSDTIARIGFSEVEAQLLSRE